MISIICVYNNEDILNKYLINSLNNQKEKYELILIDNRENRFDNAASALNHGANQANGDYFIFAHQDINFTDPQWIKNTLKEIETLNNPGIIGVAGKVNDNIVRSNIKQGLDPVDVSPYKINKAEHASTLDECVLIIPASVFKNNKFDDKTCDDWHLYGTDYVLSIQKKGFNSYIIPTTLEHRSKGYSMSQGYYDTIPHIQKKHWRKGLIRTCMGDWFTFVPVSIQRKIKQLHPY